tara:strand:- start:825 stop:1577 length:753 start_codon:yes stop_codon:yes gene_type:complete
MRTTLVAGNWKMNGTRATAVELVAGVVAGLNSGASADVAICPPFTLLDTVRQAIGESDIALGAQDLARQENGAFTGEVSGEMLTDGGCYFVIVGHSERRALFGEDNEVVAEKFVRAQAAGLVPILCVGEQLEDREGGITEEVVGAQLDAVINAAGASAFAGAVIAYEPVWAIGTGLTATPEQAQDVHAFIRARLAASDANVANTIRILYGGSVKPDNAAALFGEADIDGGLIGGAALKAEDFLGICAAAS